MLCDITQHIIIYFILRITYRCLKNEQQIHKTPIY